MSRLASSGKNSLLSPTRSRSVTETVNGSHKFVIRGYSLAKGMGVGKHIASDTFTVGGYQWAIYFYPDGKNPEDNSMYVSVFIALASEGTNVRALFELTLLDQTGRGNHKVHSHFDRSLESGPYTLKYRGNHFWGCPSFWLVITMSGFLGLAISFTSMWFLHQTGATTYSLVGSLNKIPLSVAGIVLFNVPTSLENSASIFFGLVAGVFFARAKMRERSQS